MNLHFYFAQFLLLFPIFLIIFLLVPIVQTLVSFFAISKGVKRKYVLSANFLLAAWAIYTMKNANPDSAIYTYAPLGLIPVAALVALLEALFPAKKKSV
jgi:hypothetical protein